MVNRCSVGALSVLEFSLPGCGITKSVPLISSFYPSPNRFQCTGTSLIRSNLDLQVRSDVWGKLLRCDRHIAPRSVPEVFVG